MYRHFVFSAPWTLELDIEHDFENTIPIWVELPFRFPILEKNRVPMIKNLHPLLHLAQGEEASFFLHNRACILWNVVDPVPHSI